MTPESIPGLSVPRALVEQALRPAPPAVRPDLRPLEPVAEKGSKGDRQATLEEAA